MDEQTIEQLCATKWRYLRQVAYRITGNVQSAEDAVQEALISTVTCVRRGDIIEQPWGWMLSTTRRRAWDQLRKDQRWAKRTVSVDRNATSDGDAADFHELQEPARSAEAEVLGPMIVREAFAEVVLPNPNYAPIFALAGEGLTGPQIAERLNIHVRAVYSRQERARKHIRELLQEAG